MTVSNVTVASRFNFSFKGFKTRRFDSYPKGRNSTRKKSSENVCLNKNT